MKKILIGLTVFCCMISLNAQNGFISQSVNSGSNPVAEMNEKGWSTTQDQFVFISNEGQVMDVEQNFHPEVKFMYSENYNAMYFEKNRVVCAFGKKDTYDESLYEGNQDAKDSIYRTLGMQMQRIDIEFVGASQNCTMVPGKKGNTVYNYFLNKRENISNVAAYNSVIYKNVYPNIDIVFHPVENGIKYDVILHPGANINDVKIRYNGASSLILENNEVKIKTALYDFSEELPLAFYNDDSTLKADVRYVVEGDIIRFKCDYSNSDKLIIDPTLTWATFFETSGAAGTIDYDHNVTDAAGNLFISGYCNSSANTYPTVSPGGTAYVNVWTSNDLYIAKLNPNRALVWATYFGGAASSMDWALGTEVMAVYGNVLHIVGDELATDAPFLNGGGFYYNAGTSRPYYLRFDKNTGQLLHCTNISGGYHPSIAVSPTGLVAIILHAYDFNTVHVVNRAGAYNQATNGGYTDLFLMLLNSSYTQIWGTFLGGPGTQENGHVAFDANNNIFFSAEVQWMTGSTAATEHLVGPAGAYYQTTYSGEDIMIGKFTSAGALYWNTLYGGNGNDGLDDEMGNGTKVIVNSANEMLVIGGTSSTNFPLLTLAGAYNQTCPANINAGGSYDDFASFILKFSNTGVRQWSTYWGENSATSWALLYDGKFTACNQFVVAARAVYTPIPYTGYYNKPTGGQSFLMMFNSSYAAEWSSYIGSSTSTPQICYTPFENRLYLTTNTWTNETTVNPGGGAYYDGVKNSSGCYSIWEFNMAPAPTLTGTASLCSGASTTWTASTTGGTWSSSNTGVFTVNSSTGVVTGVGTGSATLTYSVNVNSCVVSATANITITAGTTPTFTTPGPYCIGATPAALPATSNNGIAGTWSPAVISTAAAGTSIYTFTPSVPCASTATVSVTVNAQGVATISAGGPTTFCPGASVVLTAGGGSTYQWSTGATTSSITVSASGNYTVSITSGCGSPPSNPVSVTLNAPPVAIITGDNTLCAGETSVLSASTSIAGNGTITGYQWWYDNGTTNTAISGATGVTYTASQAGTYSCVITDSNGCTSVACP